MREIKFRAWWINDKRMESWEEMCTDVPYQFDLYFKPDDLNQPILMQYTGLKDKNGKEIYGGDILRAHRFTRGWGQRPQRNFEMIFEVFWDDDWHGYKVRYLKMGWDAHLGLDTPYEVIGNIYENSDLLV